LVLYKNIEGEINGVSTTLCL